MFPLYMFINGFAAIHPTKLLAVIDSPTVRRRHDPLRWKKGCLPTSFLRYRLISAKVHSYQWRNDCAKYGMLCESLEEGPFFPNLLTLLPSRIRSLSSTTVQHYSHWDMVLGLQPHLLLPLLTTPETVEIAQGFAVWKVSTLAVVKPYIIRLLDTLLNSTRVTKRAVGKVKHH